MSSSRRVDVIIVNYRSSADTLQAVQSLMPWRFGTLWLVDNSDDPVEAETLAQGIRQMPWARLLLPGKNLGFGRGCNLAFTESGAPYCLLLNPDALLSPRDLETLVDALEADPLLAAVSPRTFWDRDHRFLLPPAFPQSPLAEISLALASRYPRLCRAAFRLYLARMQRQMASPRPVETPFLAGALLLLRREAVLATGSLFDPDYFMFYEDTDLAWRLRQTGYRLAVVPAATAVHEYRHKRLKAPLMAQTRMIYFRKRHPLFHRWTRQLALLERLRQPLRWEEWGDCLSASISDAAELDAHLDGAHIVAWSPSPMMIPAAFRPLSASAVSFTPEDWQLLEPGRYMLALAHPALPGKLRYLSFERAAGSG
ncbi:MAG: N-acetylglucosaminyl-diphospho-decaprenol L-rhamnosyltransferase [Candidatus Accumulibacter phosphatis]|uniref:N-acetylglucosaminyl-diphospho-decaprenol L-rhamnosyltransferase n=1 Tax=Candidatus Accumulibacter phosphatis TaxID=327160 RepID=A0A080LU78_9PROT|nr:MAG: N-acetylglucosaminyl-diphospho-decaprenol L-rhamnosyltransferase [Candidatus Accumulibacter phosphatis]